MRELTWDGELRGACMVRPLQLPKRFLVRFERARNEDLQNGKDHATISLPLSSHTNPKEGTVDETEMEQLDKKLAKKLWDTATKSQDSMTWPAQVANKSHGWIKQLIQTAEQPRR
jgi:hypothetical protein